MSHQLISPPSLTDAAPYAYAARVAPGQLVFTAGACPLDEAGGVTPAGDLVGQCHQAVANLKVVLEAAGAGFADVVKTVIYVASDQRADLSAAIIPHFVPQPPSTLLGVSVLGYAGQLVEVEAVAAIPA